MGIMTSNHVYNKMQHNSVKHNDIKTNIEHT